MLTYLGSLTLSAAIPLLALLQVTLGPLLLELQAKLSAMIKLSGNAMLSLPAVTAALMANASAQLLLKPPTFGLEVTAAFAAQAVAKLKLQIEAILQLTKWNAVAGVHMAVYEGPISGMSAAVAAMPTQTGLPPGTEVYATILLAGAGTAATPALKAVFKTK